MRLRALATAAAIALTALPAYAHFGVLMPGSELVNRPKTPLELTLAFCHPVEQNGMNLAKPEAFDVWQNGKKTSLLNTLKETQVLKHEAWKSTFTVTRPGTYTFAFTPKPYWEPAEDKFIVHYTKVVVGAMGDEEGWEKPLGLPAEIVPLTRPFANWAGAEFRGRVLFDGKPAPEGTPIEIEFWNGSKAKLPNDYLITLQAVTGANGEFAFTAPFAGWWGFAALGDAPKMAKDGKMKDVERGAVLWTHFTKVPSQLAK